MYCVLAENAFRAQRFIRYCQFDRKFKALHYLDVYNYHLSRYTRNRLPKRVWISRKSRDRIFAEIQRIFSPVDIIPENGKTGVNRNFSFQEIRDGLKRFTSQYIVLTLLS